MSDMNFDEIYNNFNEKLKHNYSDVLLSDYCSFIFNNNLINYYSPLIRQLTELVKENNNEALWQLGIIYQNGFGVPIDYDQAINYFYKSIISNFSWNKFNYFESFIFSSYNSKYDLVLDILNTLSNNNNDAAMYHLARTYLDGVKVPTDYDLAIYWLQQSVLNHNKWATFDLFDLYLKNKSKIKLDSIVESLKILSEKGDSGAMLRLSKCYVDGLGMEQDILGGLRLMIKSAEGGNKYAPREIINVVTKTSDLEISKMFIDYVNINSLTNNPHIIESFINIYSKGIIVPKDLDTAIYYNTKLDLSLDKNLISLSSLYYQNNDIDRAKQLLENLNDPSGSIILQLARLYKNESVLPNNLYVIYATFEKALDNGAPVTLDYIQFLLDTDDISLWEKAYSYSLEEFNKGNIKYAKFIGDMYRTGKFLPKNIDESIKWYNKCNSFLELIDLQYQRGCHLEDLETFISQIQNPGQRIINRLNQIRYMSTKKTSFIDSSIIDIDHAFQSPECDDISLAVNECLNKKSHPEYLCRLIQYIHNNKLYQDYPLSHKDIYLLRSSLLSNIVYHMYREKLCAENLPDNKYNISINPQRERLAILDIDEKISILSEFPFGRYDIVGIFSSGDTTNSLLLPTIPIENIKEYCPNKILIACTEYEDIKNRLLSEFNFEEGQIITFTFKSDPAFTLTPLPLLVHFGNLNPDKIIVVAFGTGNILYNLNSFIGIYEYCFLSGFEVYTDLMNYDNNSLNRRCIGLFNPWEIYFEQTCKLAVDDIYNSQNVLIMKGGTYGAISRFPEGNDHSYGIYFKRYIHLSHYLSKNVEDNYIKLFKSREKTLGVICRGTAYRTMRVGERYPLTENELLFLINKYFDQGIIENIYVSTEDAQAYDEFVQHYGDKVFALPQKRYDRFANMARLCSEYENVFAFNESDINYLTTTCLVSKCDHLLLNSCAAAKFAIHYNSWNLKHYASKRKFGAMDDSYSIIIESWGPNIIKELSTRTDSEYNSNVPLASGYTSLDSNKCYHCSAIISPRALESIYFKFISDETGRFIIRKCNSSFFVPFHIDRFEIIYELPSPDVNVSISQILINKGDKPIDYVDPFYDITKIFMMDSSGINHKVEGISFINFKDMTFISGGKKYSFNCEEVVNIQNIIKYEGGIVLLRDVAGNYYSTSQYLVRLTI